MSDIQAQADPSNTASYRAAKLAVIVLTALIILALIGLAVGMIMKLSGRGTGAAVAPASGTAFVLPAGAKIVGMQSQGNRLVLQIRSAEGDEVDLVSLEDGHLVARIRAAGPQ